MRVDSYSISPVLSQPWIRWQQGVLVARLFSLLEEVVKTAVARTMRPVTMMILRFVMMGPVVTRTVFPF